MYDQNSGAPPPAAPMQAAPQALMQEMMKRRLSEMPRQPVAGPVPGQDGGLAPLGELGPRIDGGSPMMPLDGNQGQWGHITKGGTLGGGWGMPGGPANRPPQTSQFGYQGGGMMGSMLGKLPKQPY